MTDTMPINPDVMVWAREWSGMTVDEAVLALGYSRVDSHTIAEWESGLSEPTYRQLEKLAYKVYEVPLATFFMPNPPNVPTPRSSFRSLSDMEIGSLSGRMHRLVRDALVFQENLRELAEGEDLPVAALFSEVQVDRDGSPVRSAQLVRDLLGIDVNRQSSWRNPDLAFKQWRRALEKVGVFVFKDAFKEEGYCGFCLYDARVPVIYVNNSMLHSRQVFTLAHELAHLLFGIGGVDHRDTKVFHYASREWREIEVLCNRFAAELLVPAHDFAARIHGQGVDEATVDELAKVYSVSRAVILRRLLDQGLIDQATYDESIADWTPRRSKSGGKGGNYYKTKIAYLGEGYIMKAMLRYHQNAITLEQLGQYLTVKPKNVARLQNEVLTGGAIL